MKTKRISTLLCLLFVFFTAINAETSSISSKSLALYLGGPSGTQYYITEPVQNPTTVEIGNESIPYIITNYNWSGGISIEMSVELPQQISGIYDNLVATLSDGTTYSFQFVNGVANVSFFIPMETDKRLSVYFTLE